MCYLTKLKKNCNRRAALGHPEGRLQNHCHVPGFELDTGSFWAWCQALCWAPCMMKLVPLWGAKVCSPEAPQGLQQSTPHPHCGALFWGHLQLLLLLPAPCNVPTVPVKLVLGERWGGCPQGLPLPHPNSLAMEGEGLDPPRCPSLQPRPWQWMGAGVPGTYGEECSSFLPCLHCKSRASLQTLQTWKEQRRHLPPYVEGQS